MSIGYSRKTRRQFLIGTGHAMLALPFLPSLLPEYAQAQTAISTGRMMNFIFNHHGESAYWPARSAATTNVGTIGIKERLLSSLGTTASTAVSPFLSSSIYNTLLSQNLITVARGFTADDLEVSGHGSRAMGGCAASDVIQSGGSTDARNRSTFDYIIEISPSVYPSTWPVTMKKAVRIDLSEGLWTYIKRVADRATDIPPTYGYGGIVNMYNDVFGSLTGGTVTPVDTTKDRKTNILNRVFPAFQSYRNNRKISNEDKTRLDEHLGFLSDLQSSLANITSPPSASTCQKPAAPSSSATQLQINQLYVDLLVVAFKCGLTKFGSMQFEMDNPSWLPGYTGGSGFHGAMHGDRGLAAQHNAYESLQKFGYNTVGTRFLEPLNQLEGSTGRTYLDNMLTNFLSHAGMQDASDPGNHYEFDLQHVMFGSMGGKLRAGRYYSVPGTQWSTTDLFLPHNCFVMTLLTLMGVPASEYRLNSSVAGKGFGYYKMGPNTKWGSRIYSPITEMLA